MDTKVFYKRIIDVVNMNEIVKETIHQNEQRLKEQKGYTISEIDETIKAIKEKDKKELIDGIADVFVTAGFLEYQLSKNKKDFDDNFEKQVINKIQIDGDNFIEYLNKLKIINSQFQILSILKGIVDYIDSKTQKDMIKLSVMTEDLDVINYENPNTLMEKALIEVHKSNMSKFPNVGEKTKEQINEDIEFIKNKKGIKEVLVQERCGKIFYINKEDNKFQKPKTFVEPNFSWLCVFNESLDEILNEIKV